ncbi:Adaptor protein 1 medium subunit [Emiliania huxleyi CCMP1516]|jgi:AP-1 complex subunit mu|uniref:MHD domain-containing protein n=7 Tax=Eukaryota TaxID=2759 RepID=A0A0D3KC03_EMIH1|nr:Apm1, medium subunit of the adaptin 1 complex [Emiliania huxleyi CCMP1516]XP_005785718.1 Adaptor protein 1 medium subunit [Emiliania huxleyi CCMP1516]ALD47941.1 adaptor protein complex 1 subunit mu [Gephyrocapsa oceanica]EOD33288.1 Apm1, medium subunit of the adaptin 1 complex [Emiliania huxleyi CCMP1516]EOD33289.1 Adaptor protein 1 medium subunit [Emiliania huxleyi CCMP1516]|mmetsp:Transcript_47264/g.153386  ORF Transcript_47264/g.153386 Transcript_47264/m.153386 type:complete len:429 (+) Transcript_47264:117-1403(+)|eukprot:XP_005785717.1 Apm1, medium subunit of the adaptin 1 complex [Emiliania huxleyi CCMP1516]
MTASAVFILDMKGKVIISRNYRGDVPMNCVERFSGHVLEAEANDERPVWLEHGTTYIYIKYNNLYIMAVTQRNSNAAMILLFLYRLVEVFKDYFKELEEESIRDNFVITYELMDEMMDFGYPQVSEPKILREYITQEAHKLEVVKPPMAVTNAVSWRSEGIKHRKNEIFLDVVERLNLLVAANGTLLRSEILGSLKMRSYLSGMPELKLGLNDKLLFEATGRRTGGRGLSKGKAVEMEDIKFHQCVRLARFENDRTISFIPPDGEFELMSYRLNTQVKPLIWIEAVVEPHSHSRIEYMIKAKSQFKQRSTANNVEIVVPVPADADTPSFKTSIGTVKYAPERDAIVWSIKQFHGGKEYLMRAHFGLPSVSNEEEKKDKPPITVKFEIPYFTVSGIQVRYLKIIEKSGYQALPWVRYITQNGDYQLRMG